MSRTQSRSPSRAAPAARSCPPQPRARVGQVDAVVGQTGRTRRKQRVKIGQFLAFEPHGHRARLQNLNRTVRRLFGHIPHGLGRVAGRQRVCHADDGRVAARRRCRSTNDKHTATHMRHKATDSSPLFRKY